MTNLFFFFFGCRRMMLLLLLLWSRLLFFVVGGCVLFFVLDHFKVSDGICINYWMEIYNVVMDMKDIVRSCEDFLLIFFGCFLRKTKRSEYVFHSYCIIIDNILPYYGIYWVIFKFLNIKGIERKMSSAKRGSFWGVFWSKVSNFAPNWSITLVAEYM